MKNLIITTVYIVLLSATTFYCAAANLVWLEEDKEVIFSMAKEQDKFVLLFIGNHDCSLCKASWMQFNDPALGLKKIIEDNYVTWFESYYVPGSEPLKKSDMEHIKLYIAAYDDAKDKTAGKGTNFPILCVINPENPDEDFTVYWGVGARTYEELYEAITPPDLFAGQELKWYKDESEVLQLAKEQGKGILKMVGQATSPNSKKVMKNLNTEPLKKIVEERFILWYSAFEAVDGSFTFSTLFPLTLPLLYLIDPDNPDDISEPVSGYQDIEVLSEMLNSFTANEIILQDIVVTLQGNVLRISNLINNEQIRVYTWTGRMAAIIRKNDYSVRVDASNFPKGLLIISSSSGWSAKMIVL